MARPSTVFVASGLVLAGLIHCVGEDPPIASPPVDAGVTQVTPACEDPTFCDDKCGADLVDKCGLPRHCATCGEGRICDGDTHKCSCSEIPNLCDGRCGTIPNNCGGTKDCGGCDGGPCPGIGNCSGCVPNDVAACAGRECGPATNNCNQHIVCGSESGACPNGRVCSSAGKCCEAQSTVCAAKCGPITAACGESFECGGCARKTDTCTGGSCQCACPSLVAGGKAPNCVTRVVSGTATDGCACDASNGNSDKGNCGCSGVACPESWRCDNGMCIPP